MNDKKDFKPEERLMQIKGKDYLQVMWRIVWFRQELPKGRIETQLLTNVVNEEDPAKSYAVFKAEIKDVSGNIIASAHGSEQQKDFMDYLEKAETKAIGRALAMCGYGTQFTADELDEGSRIVDSPVTKTSKAKEPVVYSKPKEIELEPVDNKKQLINYAKLSALNMARLKDYMEVNFKGIKTDNLSQEEAKLILRELINKE